MFKEFLVKYTFINAQSAHLTQHEILRLDPGETRTPEEVLKEKWGGLSCERGGLRNLLEIKEIE